MELSKQEIELSKQEMELSKQEMELFKQEMELSKQEMESFLPLLASDKKKLFKNVSHLIQGGSN